MEILQVNYYLKFVTESFLNLEEKESEQIVARARNALRNGAFVVKRNFARAYLTRFNLLYFIKKIGKMKKAWKQK